MEGDFTTDGMHYNIGVVIHRRWYDGWWEQVTILVLLNSGDGAYSLTHWSGSVDSHAADNDIQYALCLGTRK